MNILIPSIGRRSYLIDYFRNALRLNNLEGEIIVCNSHVCQGFGHADKAFIAPRIFSDEYIPFLLNLCRDYSISIIIPVFDLDLPVLSAHLSDFKNIGVNVIVSTEDVIKICNDKWETYKFLKSVGLSTPKSTVELNEATKFLNNGQLKFPVVLKPRWGMGSIGIHVAENTEELKVLYRILRREIFASYLMESAENDPDRCIIIQEMIKGQEYGIDTLSDLNCNPVSFCAKRKIQMRGGETDIAEIVNNRKFKSIYDTIAGSLKVRGVLDIDIIIGDDGEQYVIDLNARFGGQYPFTHIAGSDFTTQIIAWSKGMHTRHNHLRAQPGIIAGKFLTISKI